MIPAVMMGLSDEQRNHLLDSIYDPSNNIGPRVNFPGETFTQKQMYNLDEQWLEFSERLIDMTTAIFGGDQYGIGHMWGVAYNKGDEIYIHNHGEYTHAFVYYVKCCENCAPIVFPNMNQVIAPETDKLLVWENNTTSQHYVPPHECDHDRVVVSGHILRFS